MGWSFGGSKGDWGGVTVDQKCDINQRGLKDIGKVCHLMEVMREV